MEVPCSTDTIRILIDRKNYTQQFVAGAHIDVSIQDAIRNNADGALVCYTELPAKYGGTDFVKASRWPASARRRSIMQMSWLARSAM